MQGDYIMLLESEDVFERIETKIKTIVVKDALVKIVAPLIARFQ